MKVYLPRHSEEVIFEIQNEFKKTEQSAIQVEPENKILGLTLVEASSLGIFTIQLINLLYLIYKEKIKEEEWTIERIETILKKELIKEDKFKYEILDVNNFKGLIDDTYQPCVVSVETNSNEIFKFSIYRNGNIFKIEKST